MRISDWSSDVCSSDLAEQRGLAGAVGADDADDGARRNLEAEVVDQQLVAEGLADVLRLDHQIDQARASRNADAARLRRLVGGLRDQRLVGLDRSEEHQSELQTLMRKSYAVFCLKKKNTTP